MVSSPTRAMSLLGGFLVHSLLCTSTLAHDANLAVEARSTPTSTANASISTPISIPFFALPTSYPLSLQPQDPTDEAQIRNTLAHYPLAIDGKNFDALDQVFTADVVANYSEPLGVLSGLEQVKSVLNASLFPVRTQHAYGTQVIELSQGGGGKDKDKDGDGDVTAKSVTYYTASHFGQGDTYGQVLYAYGQYQDELVKDAKTKEWRIKARTLVYMGPNVGNLSVFTP